MEPIRVLMGLQRQLFQAAPRAANGGEFLPVPPRNSGFTAAADHVMLGKRPGLLTPLNCLLHL